MGNVRTVLTEGRDTTRYQATMESAASATENELFANAYTSVNTSFAKPPGFDSDSENLSVSKLTGVAVSNGTGGRMGPAIVLKVMAGDKVQINSFGFYNSTCSSRILT